MVEIKKVASEHQQKVNASRLDPYRQINVSKVEYRDRRNRMISLMDSNSIAILAAAQPHIRNRDVEYPFRQNSDFFI